MAPLTLALAFLMISRVPYPSFKTINLNQRAQVELVALMLLVLAMLFAMPQFTFFMLATAYVASGPYLLLRGRACTSARADAGAITGRWPCTAAAQGPFSRRCSPRHRRFVREFAASGSLSATSADCPA